MTAPALAPDVRRMKFSEWFAPTARQQEAFTAVRAALTAAEAGVLFLLYGGARGGGKSAWLRALAVWLLLFWASQGHKHVRVAIFCETYPELWQRQLSRAQNGRPSERYPAWLGTWNMSTREFRLHEEYGGGTVAFLNLDDPAKYQSAEFAAALVDELTKNKLEVFTTLRGSIRWPGIEATIFAASTNPGSVGHAWVKDVWVDGTFGLEETKGLLEQFGRAAFVYIKALATDNQHNAASYVKMLQSLPPRLRAAWLHGSWDVFEGQAFSEFHRDVHVRPNRIQHLIDGEWQFIGVMDWGFRKGVYYLVAISPDRRRIEVVWEALLLRTHARQAAKAIFTASRRFPRPEYIKADDQMWSDTGVKQGSTLADEFLLGMVDAFGSLEACPPFLKGTKGKGSRATRYSLMHKLLAWGGAKAETTYPAPSYDALPRWHQPGLTIQARCQYLVQTLPALPVDPDTPDEDIDTDADDHGYDAVGFALLDLGAEKPDPDSVLPVDRHPGFDPKKRARRPHPNRTRLPAPEPAPERTRYERVPLDDYEPVTDFR